MAFKFTIAKRIRPEPALLAARVDIQQPYNENFSCPLTPFENRLKVPIRAGEKLFPHP